jgi:hypothetical protein
VDGDGKIGKPGGMRSVEAGEFDPIPTGHLRQGELFTSLERSTSFGIRRKNEVEDVHEREERMPKSTGKVKPDVSNSTDQNPPRVFS